MAELKKTLLIFGATGKQGGACLQALQSTHSNVFSFRTVTRNPTSAAAQKLAATGVQVLKGDATDGDSLKVAMKDFYGVFLVTTFDGKGGIEGEVTQGITVIDAAVAAGVKYIVFTSVGGLTTELGREVPHFGSKHRIEQYLKSKAWADGYAILRPVAFMENLELFGPLTQGSLSFLIPSNTLLQLISVKDIGEFAALAFTNPKLFRGKETEIAGDELTGIGMAKVLSTKTGLPWTYSQLMPTWALRFLSFDFYKMEIFFEQEGCKADIPSLRTLKPNLQSFSDYLSSLGVDNIPKGVNRYKFKQPRPWGLYVGGVL
ncbi:hypothetical protein HDU93_007437, partial [Gonapodya sp. JEL0774]